MSAASAGHLVPRTAVSTMLKTGARTGLRVGAQMGLVRFGTSFYEQIQPLTGIKSWAHWLLQSENTLIEWVRTITFSHYLKNAAYDALFAFLRTFLENICTELITGHFPWLEKHILYQLEYLWRGIQGRTLRPPTPERLDLPATSMLLVDYQQWSPICHPTVEYSKPSTTWSPRMFAACEASKFAIPSLSVFIVGAGFDMVTFICGYSSTRRLVTRLWKDFYAGVGALVGIGSFAAIWSLCSHRLLPMFPLRAQSVLPGLVPQLGMALGSYMMVNLLFKQFWGFDDNDEPLPSFEDGAALERQRRLIRYGPYKSQFARPPELAPVAPEFIDAELNETFLRECFPERVPPPPAAKRTAQPGAVDDDAAVVDPATSLRMELNRARRRNATNSHPVSALPSRTASPATSRHNSDDEDSSSDDDDSDSASDAKSSSSEESESGDGQLIGMSSASEDGDSDDDSLSDSDEESD